MIRATCQLLVRGALVALLVPVAQLAAQGFSAPLFGPSELVGGQVLILSDPATGDLDGDGLPEYLAYIDNDDGDKGVLVFANHDGTLAPPQLCFVPTTFIPMPVALADLDADGALDVVAGKGGQLFTLRGLGDGTLAPYVDSGLLPAGSARLALGDVDGDGLVDAVVGTNVFGQPALVASAPGLGDGTFGTSQAIGSVPAATAGVTMLRVRDVDDDGRLDVVTQGGKFPFPANMFDVFRGTGGGSFAHLPQLVLASGSAGVGFDLADLDHDGRIDLLVAAYGSGVRVALGLGGGLFGTPFAVETGLNMGTVRAVDLDLDGYADILGDTGTAQRMGPGVQPLGAPLQFPQAFMRAAVADFDGDALPDVAFLDKTVWPTPLLLARNVLGPVIDAGYGSPAGPTLVVTGTPQAGTVATLLVSGPPAGSPAFVVLGWHPSHLALGSSDLVPSADAVLPVQAGVPLTTRWPDALVPGAPLYLQAVTLAPAPAVSHAFVIVP